MRGDGLCWCPGRFKTMQMHPPCNIEGEERKAAESKAERAYMFAQQCRLCGSWDRLGRVSNAREVNCFERETEISETRFRTRRHLSVCRSPASGVLDLRCVDFGHAVTSAREFTFTTFRYTSFNLLRSTNVLRCIEFAAVTKLLVGSKESRCFPSANLSAVPAVEKVRLLDFSSNASSPCHHFLFNQTRGPSQDAMMQ